MCIFINREKCDKVIVNMKCLSCSRLLSSTAVVESSVQQNFSFYPHEKSASFSSTAFREDIT